MRRLSTGIYGAMLRLYPSELRRDFGPEITELFREDLDDALRSQGFAGAVRVWWCAACEVLRIAVPAHQMNPVFVVPAISFAFSFFPLGFILAVAPVGPRPVLEDVALFIVCPGLVSASMAIAAVRSGKVRVMSLDLN